MSEQLTRDPRRRSSLFIDRLAPGAIPNEESCGCPPTTKNQMIGPVGSTNLQSKSPVKRSRRYRRALRSGSWNRSKDCSNPLIQRKSTTPGKNVATTAPVQALYPCERCLRETGLRLEPRTTRKNREFRSLNRHPLTLADGRVDRYEPPPWPPRLSVHLSQPRLAKSISRRIFGFLHHRFLAIHVKGHACLGVS